MKKYIVVIGVFVSFTLVLLGAGCRKAPSPSSSAANAPAAPAAADPLADDLDAAVEDLNVIE